MVAQRSIVDKPAVRRRAVASGRLRLRSTTLSAIRRGRVAKGDPLRVAEVAGLLALKRTPELIPHCHPIPVGGSRVELTVGRTEVRARAEVEAVYRTGVEMEALVAVTVALLTVWDMVKYLEKDETGGYPAARMTDVRVLAKAKGDPTEER